MAPIHLIPQDLCALPLVLLINEAVPYERFDDFLRDDHV
jgi:hypothetical protein